MQKPQAFMFYVNDWLTSPTIIKMTPEQRGAYIQLLAFQWQSEGLSDDDDALAIMSGLGPRWLQDSNNLVVKKNFPKCEDGKLRNQRLENERILFYESRTKQSEGGKKAMAKRYSKLLTSNLQDTYKLDYYKEVKRKELTTLKDLKEKDLKDKHILSVSKENELCEHDIFNHWNSKKSLIKHRIFKGNLLTQVKSGIKKRITEGFTIPEIKEAIDNYDKVISEPETYYFSYKWSLDLFLKQDNAFRKFVNDAEPLKNFQRKDNSFEKEDDGDPLERVK